MRKIILCMTLLCISLCANAQSSKYDVNGDGKVNVNDVVEVVNVSLGLKTSSEFVDLRLPSGTLWAIMNVGANSPEDYGDYFAWGETTGYNGPKASFDWNTYSLCDGTSSNMSKYCSADGKTELESSDDAAYVNWGSDWAIPSYDQLNELKTECTWTWTTQNGVKGYKVTGDNGNSIFLPAAGCYNNLLHNAGSYGYYSSRNLSTTGDDGTSVLNFFEDDKAIDYDSRCYGYSIRPVRAVNVVRVSSISLDKTSLTIERLRTGTLTATILPEGASNKGVIWSSSDESVVTVSEDGVVTGVAVGTATITCTSEDDDEITATCEVTVEELIDGGIYYLYNTESGNFLTRGSYWGTKAVAYPVGLPWKVTVADGAYKLQMYDLTVAGSTTGYGSNGYCDNGTPIAFTPAGDAATGYTLANGTNFLGQDGQLGTTSATWQFLTQAQYTAKLAAKATSQESAIATAAGITLDDATLESVVSNNYWTNTTDDGIPTLTTWPVTYFNMRNDAASNENTSYGCELYQLGGYYAKTITGLKQGIYKVTVRAMKRVGTNANCYTMGEAGYPVSDAYLDANGYIIPIQSWYEGCASNGNPNTTGQFMSQVNAGKYKASGYVYVGSDGTMDLKAISEAYWSTCWFLFDGIEYTYYSSDGVSSDDVTALEATIPTGKMDATIEGTMNDAKNALDAAPTIKNYNALSTAIAAANTSIAAYSSAKAIADKANAMATAAKVDVTTVANAFATAYNAGTLNGTTEADAVASAYETALSAKLAEYTDISSKITNPSFEQGSINGWTNDNLASGASSNGNFTKATGSYFVEKWTWSAGSGYLADGTLTQTISNLPAGEYILTAEMKNEQQGGNTAGTGFYLTVGDNQVEVNSVTGETYALSFTTTAKSDITIGAKLTSCTGNWACMDNFKLYFNGIGPVISLSSTSLELVQGKSSALTATIYPENASTTTLTWSSSDESVATVSADGVVTGVAAGTATITCTANDGSGVAATCIVKVLDTNGHAYVDLGLTSGTLWATMNVGATTAEGYGDYFAWGETTGYNSGKTTFDWSTYTLCNGSETTMTKYCTDSSYGTVDNQTELLPADDAAHVNWGGDWMMPSKTQQDELRTECTWTWTTQNSVNGYKVTGTNGNSIFLPAAGDRYGSSLREAGSCGFYWSRTLSSSSSYNAWDLVFHPSNFYANYYYRYCGRSVRPVLGAQN